MSRDRVLAVIPARHGSTRFPGKPLALLAGRTLVEHVWRRTADAGFDRLVIATDDERVVAAARSFGAEAWLTDPGHPSGTDRCAEVARRLGEAHAIVINVQGDEPLITPASLAALAHALEVGERAAMATLAEPIADVAELFDPNVVKVVTAEDGRALYFSRAPIPYHRGAAAHLAADFREALGRRPGGLAGYRKHQGVYAYRAEVLAALTLRAPSPLERDEGLEQLRALEAGYEIRVLDSDYRSMAVDTPEDLVRVARELDRRRQECSGPSVRPSTSS